MPLTDYFKGTRLYVLLWTLLLVSVGLLLWRPWQPKALAAPLSPYLSLRQAALNTKAADLNLGFDLGSGDVYGVVMDWDYGHGVVTLVALKNGDSSLYMDNGSAFMGGQGYPAIKAAAQRLVEKSQYIWVKAERIKGLPEPQPGLVRFFFLTPGGLWSAYDKAENVQQKASVWNQSFEVANDLITQWRFSEVGKSAPGSSGRAKPKAAGAS